MNLVLSIATPKGEAHLQIDNVPQVPAVGDWVDREESGWRGLVVKRWWSFDKRGRVECRVLLDDGGNTAGNQSSAKAPSE